MHSFGGLIGLADVPVLERVHLLEYVRVDDLDPVNHLVGAEVRLDGLTHLHKPGDVSAFGYTLLDPNKSSLTYSTASDKIDVIDLLTWSCPPAPPCRRTRSQTGS